MENDALHHQEPVLEETTKEKGQIESPQKPSHSWIQAITRVIKNRTLRIMGLSLAVHAAAATTPIFTKDEPKIEKAKTGIGKALRSLEETNLISLLNDDDEIVKTLNAQNTKKVEEKKEERAARIDPAKIAAHKLQLKEQVAKEGKIRFIDFFEKYEELVMGIDPAIIKKGKDFFLKQMAELKSHKDKITDKRMLEMLSNLIYDAEEDYSTTDDSETSVFEYLASQADAEQKDNAVLKGNCKTRYKKMVMGVEELFPGQENDIFIQRFDDADSGHFRGGFRLNKNESYAFEPEKLVQLTDENKAGTLIQNSHRMIQRYLGLPLEPIKAEPGEYTPGGTSPHVHIDDGLSERLPEGVHLKAASDNPAEGHANWKETVDEIKDNIAELEKRGTEERANNGITEMEILKGYPLLPQEVETKMQEWENIDGKNGKSWTVVPIAVLSSANLSNFENRKRKLPTSYFSGDGKFSYLSSDTLKAAANIKGGDLGIFISGVGFPAAFVDALDPGESEGRAVWLNDFELDEEEAGIIAEMNQGGTWLAPGKIMYGDNILRILATTKAPLHMNIATSNQIAKYKQQSPWFFENKYYAYMYSEH